MAIEDRLKPEIKFSSPDGGSFTAKWIGDPITKENKLGLFDSPKVKGTVVQPLEPKGDIYQLVVFFDGEDHDEDSADFWSALDEKGAWTVTHPINGKVDNLYLSRVTWENEPVRNVGFTTFNTNWIQGLPVGTSVSFPELKSSIGGFSLDAIDSTINQFISAINLDSFEEFNALVSGVNKAVNIIKKSLRKFENLQIINPRLEALFRGISSTIESFPPDLSALSAQFVGLFEAIGLAQNNAIGSVDNFTSFGNDIQSGGIENDDPSTTNKNAVAVTELNLSLAAIEIAKAAILPGITTRDQAIETANSLNDYLKDMTDALDASQTAFNVADIENQFISQSKAYSDQLKLNKKSIEFLLSSALNLLIERKFTIKTERCPLEIAWTELGGPGEIVTLPDGLRIDKHYNDFCEWNNLHGKNVMRLPSETTVRIFV